MRTNSSAGLITSWPGLTSTIASVLKFTVLGFVDYWDFHNLLFLVIYIWSTSLFSCIKSWRERFWVFILTDFLQKMRIICWKSFNTNNNRQKQQHKDKLIYSRISALTSRKETCPAEASSGSISRSARRVTGPREAQAPLIPARGVTGSCLVPLTVRIVVSTAHAHCSRSPPRRKPKKFASIGTVISTSGAWCTRCPVTASDPSTRCWWSSPAPSRTIWIYRKESGTSTQWKGGRRSPTWMSYKKVSLKIVQVPKSK